MARKSEEGLYDGLNNDSGEVSDGQQERDNGDQSSDDSSTGDAEDGEVMDSDEEGAKNVSYFSFKYSYF